MSIRDNPEVVDRDFKVFADDSEGPILIHLYRYSDDHFRAMSKERARSWADELECMVIEMFESLPGEGNSRTKKKVRKLAESYQREAAAIRKVCNEAF